MKRLFLLRHAKAMPGDGGSDHERVLAERGRRDAPAMGRAIAQRGYRPDLILCSSARRTAETLELVLPFVLPAPSCRMEPVLYHAEAGAILDRMTRLDAAAGAVLVVGHNPGLEDLALHLAGDTKIGRRLEAGLVTAGFVAFETDAADWRAAAEGAWRALDYLKPADL